MAYTDLLSGIFYHLIMTNASFLKKSLQIFSQNLPKNSSLSPQGANCDSSHVGYGMILMLARSPLAP
jgi:hypothetical protein